jgi:NADPH-dependent 2,4-dienoyl-CoA reductase/sulfur reductase-like enzyme
MDGSALNRRSVLKTLALGATATATVTAFARPVFAQAKAKVVVIGGGFAGATCARFLKRHGLDVALVERNPAYISCPLSNAVLTGLRPMEGQTFGYDAVRREGITVIHEHAARVDPQARQVRLDNGTILDYDRLVLAPGIDMRFDALPGYDEAVAETVPHAWKAGPQTTLLQRQLEAMEDGGVVVMSVPPVPYRCPPGPYERASLIAHYLKTRKPRSKLIVLDAKDSFSKQKLFQAAWRELYPDTLEWVGLSQGGQVTAFEPKSKTFVTDFERYPAAVANVIPPQKAGAIAFAAQVTDRSGWCPIDPVTFESRLQPNIHVIGDSAIAGAMPKSAFAANAQAKVCAAAVATLLEGGVPTSSKLINTCYSLVAPDYGISVAGVYAPANGVLADIEGAGGVSPLDAPHSVRSTEAHYAEAWFETIAAEVFG